MTTKAQRETHQQWLVELTAIPTAAGCEQQVIAWVKRWMKSRKNLRLTPDNVGNLLMTHVDHKKSATQPKPLYITAHLDHPAFVVREILDDETIELEFRGGVYPPYFENAKIEIFDGDGRPHRATIVESDFDAKPFTQLTAKLSRPSNLIESGRIGRWIFSGGSEPRIRDGLLHTPACDDLAAVAAALSTLDVLHRRKGMTHVGVLLTRAEEIGFVGAIAAAKNKSIPKSARLICLENSRSFAESPIGAGPILRVGDRISVFSPELTNRLGDILTEHKKKHDDFKYQRKLMPGGACEATAFATYGYESTCICLPLGNYHNMQNIDAVQAGKRPAKIAKEYISIEDYHGMVEMLILCAQQLDAAKVPPRKDRLENRLKANRYVLK